MTVVVIVCDHFDDITDVLQPLCGVWTSSSVWDKERKGAYWKAPIIVGDDTSIQHARTMDLGGECYRTGLGKVAGWQRDTQIVIFLLRLFVFSSILLSAATHNEKKENTFQFS